MQSTKKLVNVGSTLENIEKSNKERQKAFEDIADVDATFRNGGEASAVQAVVSAAAEQKIKGLEYEVALLKSRLYRAEAEAEELKSLLQKSTQGQSRDQHSPSQPTRQSASK